MASASNNEQSKDVEAVAEEPIKLTRAEMNYVLQVIQNEKHDPRQLLQESIDHFDGLQTQRSSDRIELFDIASQIEAAISSALRLLTSENLDLYRRHLQGRGYIVTTSEEHRQHSLEFCLRLPREKLIFGLDSRDRDAIQTATLSHFYGTLTQAQGLAQSSTASGSDFKAVDLDSIREHNCLRFEPRGVIYYTYLLGDLFRTYRQSFEKAQAVDFGIRYLFGFGAPARLRSSRIFRYLLDPADRIDFETSFETGSPFSTKKESDCNSSDSTTVSYISESTKVFGNMEIAQGQLPLPLLPPGWSAEKDFKAIGTLSVATERSIEPVGPHFLAHARRARNKRTFSEDDRIQAQENVKKVEEDDSGEISEPEDPMMLSRDAKDWKSQDHYAVLGLSKYRYKATEEQIKRAHRKKVLRHHPDKKAAAGSTEDDSFFKCIQKATEILLDPVKRRQFDSVDENADVEPPTKKQTQKGNFYKLWGPVFKSEGRFSKLHPVPKLGDENSTKEDVENFYNFWYNFDSWRSFEYQDEDVPDDNENRDQKRHMERKNNNARKKKKTEDSARLRKLLDDASALDERIKKFRNEANAQKNKKRLEREAAEKKAIEDAKAAKEAEAAAAKAAEETAKAEREQGKKAKEAAKNAIKKNKRVLKASVKDANYFVSGDASAATIDGVLNDVELIQSKLEADEMADLAAKLSGLKAVGDIKAVWNDEVGRLRQADKLKDGDAKFLA